MLVDEVIGCAVIVDAFALDKRPSNEVAVPIDFLWEDVIGVSVYLQLATMIDVLPSTAGTSVIVCLSSSDSLVDEL